MGVGRKGKRGEREEDGDCVIGRWRVVDVNGSDGFKFKVCDRLRSEFQIFEGWSQSANDIPLTFLTNVTPKVEYYGFFLNNTKTKFIYQKNISL